MGYVGLFLLGLALLLMTSTGWPTWVVLVGVSTLGALGGIAAGAFDAALLGSLPARIVGLLEQDLLQALALYALVGALLHHLALADSLCSALRKVLARFGWRSASALSGLGLGLLLAPMNGSVGASLLTVARTAGARWSAEGMPGAERAVLVAVASTLGVIVPPSLVLLLLGDAMMRAHTEGLQLAHSLGLPAATAGLRIVNTQDVLQAVLLPGALVLLCWLALTARRAPGTSAPLPREPLTAAERRILCVVPSVIVVLLGLVAVGKVRAVEAAAAAGLLLLLWGLLSRRLQGPVLGRVLDDAMAMTGALFALLVAATTFSLLLRAFGTDLLVADAMRALQGRPLLAVGVVLAILLGCAFVLDAFELIFLVVPIVMPPLLALVDDAAWVAALTLLALQLGFLLPPFGYAVVLARGQTQPRPGQRAMLRVLAPYLGSLVAVIVLVATVPATTRWLRSAPLTLPAAALSADEIEQQMRQMSEPAPEAESAPDATMTPR